MSEQYDLVVIGAGSGGVRASRMAAATGAKVAVIENMYMGGTCVNVGCVPKKLFVYASEFSAHLDHAEGFGLEVIKKHFDWKTLRDNKTKEINRLNGIYNKILEGPGVEIIRGTGSIKAQGIVCVGDRELHTKRILIATGGWPFKPNVPGIEHAIDSNDVFSMEAFPKDIIVVGGGYIAVEFAGIFKGLGANTRLLYRGDQILRGFDQEVRDYAAQEITKSGVEISVNTDIKAIEKLANGRISCTLTDDSNIECGTLMYATGRRPKTDNLGLEELGVTLRKDGTIVTDDKFETNIPGVFALGDVIGTPALTPVALQQGMVFVDQQFGEGKRTIDYKLIPTAVFCQPNIGTVGLTEEEAVAAHPSDIDIFTSEFKPLKHTITGADERTLMKLVVRRSDDRVIGVHMVGEAAGEILQGLAVAMQAGATKAHLDSTIGIHPTAAEEFVTMRSVTRSL
jgi:glutathione reductase (NADPH)